MFTNNYKLLALMAVLLSPLFVIQSQNHSDCIGAIPICQEIYYEENSYSGVGNIENEVDEQLSCFGPASTGQVEINSTWYMFTSQSVGDLCFSIIPNSNDDYDYGVYDISTYDCEDISELANMEVSCNFAPNLGCGGVTGPTGDIDATNNCSGQNEECVPVNVGETYVILVTNYSGSEDGYTIDFTASTADIYDNSSPEISSITGIVNEDVATNDNENFAFECGTDQILMKMSENIICEQLNVDLVAVQNMLGISNKAAGIVAPDCDLGGVYDNKYFVEMSTPLLPGVYDLTIDLGSEQLPSLIDPCGNVPTLANVEEEPMLFKQFEVGEGINFPGGLATQIACVNDQVSLSIEDPTTDGSYFWVLNTDSGKQFLGEGSNFEIASTVFTSESSVVSVYYIDESSCSYSTPRETTVLTGVDCVGTGIAEEHFLNSPVFPNPANDFLRIDLKQNANAQIFTLSGKLVHSGDCTIGSNRIDIAHLQAGIYLLSISDGDMQYSSKLIVR